MSLARKIFGVGIWTGLSRVTGFVRDMLIGRYLGAGRLSDIFLTAFKLPNLFRDLLGEGAMSSVFIPMFSGEKKNSHFASNAFSWLMLVLLVITILVEIFMPFIIFGMAPGFDASKLSTTVEVARIMFFYCILVCGASFLAAVLNAFSDFVLAAAVPILLNIFLIFGAIIFTTNLYAQSFVVLLSGIAQMIILWGRLKKRKFGLRLIRPVFTPTIKRMIKRMGWGLLGSGFYQLNVFVGVLLASYQSGAVSYLYYSDRLIQLPFAIVGLAAGTVILTKISDAIAAKKTSAVFKYQNAAIRQSMMLIAPSIVALFVLAEPIVRLLFEYGQWAHSATIAVALAIMIQVFSLPFMTTSQVYMKTLYAAGDMKTPVKIGAIALGLGVVIMISTVSLFGYLCVPIGTVFAGAIRNLQLKYACKKLGLYKTDKNTVMAVTSFFLLSTIMGFCLWFAKPFINGLMPMAVIMAASIIIYLPLALFCDKIIKK
jgi:putative peptidoglycan lipid II flippase